MRDHSIAYLHIVDDVDHIADDVDIDGAAGLDDVDAIAVETVDDSPPTRLGATSHTNVATPPDRADDADEPDDADLDERSLVALYLREAARYPRLTAADERELSRRIHDEDDADAEERFIESNLRLVVSVAKEYQAHGLSLLDLIQEGNIGLMKAIKRYDGRKGFRFSTYGVWWIRQQITRAIWSSHGPLKVPTRLIDEHRRVMRDRQRQDDGSATASDAGTISGAMEPDAAPWSVVAVSGEEAALHLDALPAAEADGPSARADNADLLETIYKALRSVSRRDRQIIGELFGLDDTTPIKVEQVAQRHHITCERVRQIKKAAFDSVRRSPYADQLIAY